VHNERYGELGIEPFEVQMRDKLGLVVAPAELGGIVSIVNRLISERESYRKRIVGIRAENVFNFGQSNEVGAQYIVELLAKKPIRKSE
jgi:YidC/Oxa1 family membrane protein insertase